MREIKFRAWDKVNNIILYGADLYNVHLHLLENNSRFEWLQYTGLKDKNEKEIYEGDIVKTVYPDYPEKAGTVYFQPTRLNWSVKHSNYTNQDLFIYARPDHSIEIIGNIYENPELL